MNTAETLRRSLQEALHTCDWLQAIASARELLELEPDALRERHLLAQLYLRVSGSRLAAVQFRKVLQQAVRRRELWKAIAALKSLEALGPSEAGTITSGQVFGQVVRPQGHRGGQSDAFPPALERMSSEQFDKFCRDMQLISLMQNDRWSVPGGGASLLVAVWGRAWLERDEESIEASEGEILFLVPPEGEGSLEVLGLEETCLLHLAPEALAGFHAEVPGLESLASTPAPVRADAAPPAAPEVVGPPLIERDDVLFAARLVVHVEGADGRLTLAGVVSGLNESGACFECEHAHLPVDPATLEGMPVALQVALRTEDRPYRWIGRLDWVRTGSTATTQGFRCGVRWDGLSDEDRAAVSSLRGARGSEAHRLWELWNSSLGNDR
ncbi:MAG: hypothetical protein HZB25_10740 [Candidatus Eisenbacteria bacterium]|nr:hypothetical protein [Candidatus Eisenbacteria bacterium]